MPLTDGELQEACERLAPVIAENVWARIHNEYLAASVDAKTHADHHRFIEGYLVELEDRKRRRNKVIDGVKGWGVVAIIIGFGRMVWIAVEEIVKRWVSGPGP